MGTGVCMQTWRKVKSPVVILCQNVVDRVFLRGICLLMLYGGEISGIYQKW